MQEFKSSERIISYYMISEQEFVVCTTVAHPFGSTLTAPVSANPLLHKSRSHFTDLAQGKSSEVQSIHTRCVGVVGRPTHVVPNLGR